MKNKLGIIGGGQLGGFLCQAAQNLGLHSTVLSTRVEGLAKELADNVLEAALDDLAAVDQLIEHSDAITFELEDVPIATLHKLQEAQTREQNPVAVYPDPKTMLLLQNKGLQKDWLAECGFPTTPHIRFDDGLDADAALAKFGDTFIIKTQRGGYDGLGVKAVRNGAIPQGYEDIPVIAEAAVQDFVEIAVLVARDATGHCSTFPVFESVFDDAGNVVRRVMCPAAIEDTIAEQAKALACDIANQLDTAGIFAVEYFLTEQELLVNEIAPRVHNVGHLTIEASETSQFEQQVRAVMGLPLAVDPEVTPAVMENLLYEDAIADACINQTIISDNEAVTVHWYGKSGPRPLRKMGHLTTTAQTVEEAGQLADNALKQLRKPA